MYHSLYALCTFPGHVLLYSEFSICRHYSSTKHKLAFLKATKSARDFTFVLNLLSKQTYLALLEVKRKFILCFGLV